MSNKYVNRIMDEVYDNFHNHYDGDVEEITWFLEPVFLKKN